MDSLPAASPPARARAVTLVSVAILFIFIVASQLQAGVDLRSLTRVALLSIPLILPLRGLILGNRYTYRWASLCVLPYFVISLAEAFANPAYRFWGTAILGASLLWFFALIAFLRVTQPRSDSD